MEQTKELENKIILKRRLNEKLLIRFIIDNTEKEERGRPTGFHRILGEDHVMLKTEHAGGITAVIPLHNIEQILTDTEDDEETIKEDKSSTDCNTTSESDTESK